MAKKLDERLVGILKAYHPDPRAALWDCHGTWVIYHKDCELIAAKNGITFDPPQVLDSDGAAGVVSMCVTGRLGDKVEWSIGEAAPKNNKNAYPWAMAEKRAKDRVILKLLGLHGEIYSEEEADDFKEAARNQRNKPTEDGYADHAITVPGDFAGEAAAVKDRILDRLERCTTREEAQDIWKASEYAPKADGAMGAIYYLKKFAPEVYSTMRMEAGKIMNGQRERQAA